MCVYIVSDLHLLRPWWGLFLWVETLQRTEKDNDGRDCRYGGMDKQQGIEEHAEQGPEDMTFNIRSI